MSSENKVAIISGASRGIGRAIALRLAKNKIDISFNFLKNKQAAESLVKELEQLGVKAKAYQVDIRDYNAVINWADTTKQCFGRLDILINNAGIVRDKALMFMEKQDWHQIIDTNLNGVYNLTHAVIVGFMRQKRGNIVNITSVSGLKGAERQTNYSASKAGVIGFTKALAREVAAFGIRVNAVAPGFIDTDMLRQLKDERINNLLKRIPRGRLGRPEEIAAVVEFLISDMAKYITGQVITVDGGLTM